MSAVGMGRFGSGWGGRGAGGSSGFYTGYDISPVMLEAAMSRISSPRVRFVCAPYPTEQADYTLASGLFGLKLGVSDQEWETWVEDLIVRMAQASRRGLACNFLDKAASCVSADALVYRP